MEKQTVFKRLTHEETTSPDGSVITGLKYDKDGNVEMIYWLRPVEGYFMTEKEWEVWESKLDYYREEVERLQNTYEDKRLPEIN